MVRISFSQLHAFWVVFLTEQAVQIFEMLEMSHVEFYFVFTVLQMRTKKNKFEYPQHALWVLKRTVSMRGSFERPKHMFKLMGKMIVTLLR